MIERILSLAIEPEILSIVIVIIIVCFLVGYLILSTSVIEEKSRVREILDHSFLKMEELQKRSELYKKIDKQLTINGILYSELIKEEENSKQVIIAKLEYLNKEYILNIKCNGVEETNEPFTTIEALYNFLSKNTIFRLGDFIAR